MSVAMMRDLVATVILLLVIINGVAALALCLLQLGLILQRRQAKMPTPLASGQSESVFISVHVATHNEPPALVIETLARLADLTGVAHEVVVVDNNTTDPKLWEPVAAAAAALGPHFRFRHVDGVVGAKAGALNIALDLADPRTTHVAVVDADYQVHPDFLTDAVAGMTRSGAAYVQFPQAYRGVGAGAHGVERELGDYFACFAGNAGQVGAMLLTGTLSVLEVGALRAVGGWSPATITEDAELGLRLQAAGRRGIWLPAERGNGILPLDFDSLRKQRARWVAGNMQCLRKGLLDGSLWASPVDTLALVAQLTAWVSLWLVPAVVLLAMVMVPDAPLAQPIAVVAAATILVSAGLTAARMRLAMPAPAARVWSSALVTKLALSWTAALAWMPALAGRPLVFQRTRKDASSARRAGIDAVFALSFAAAAAAVVYASRGAGIEAAACLLLAAIWPCGRRVDANLRASARTV